MNSNVSARDRRSDTVISATCGEKWVGALAVHRSYAHWCRCAVDKVREIRSRFHEVSGVDDIFVGIDMGKIKKNLPSLFTILHSGPYLAKRSWNPVASEGHRGMRHWTFHKCNCDMDILDNGNTRTNRTLGITGNSQVQNWTWAKMTRSQHHWAAMLVLLQLYIKNVKRTQFPSTRHIVLTFHLSL